MLKDLGDVSVTLWLYRTPLYGPHPLNKDTSLLHTVSMVPSVSDQQGLTVFQLFSLICTTVQHLICLSRKSRTMKLKLKP